MLFQMIRRLNDWNLLLCALCPIVQPELGICSLSVTISKLNEQLLNLETQHDLWFLHLTVPKACKTIQTLQNHLCTYIEFSLTVIRRFQMMSKLKGIVLQSRFSNTGFESNEIYERFKTVSMEILAFTEVNNMTQFLMYTSPWWLDATISNNLQEYRCFE